MAVRLYGSHFTIQEVYTIIKLLPISSQCRPLSLWYHFVQTHVAQNALHNYETSHNDGEKKPTVWLSADQLTHVVVLPVPLVQFKRL